MAPTIATIGSMDPGDIAIRFGSTSNRSRARIEVGRTNDLVAHMLKDGEAKEASDRYVSSIDNILVERTF